MSRPKPLSRYNRWPRRLLHTCQTATFLLSQWKRCHFLMTVLTWSLAAPYSTLRGMKLTGLAMVREMWRVLKPGGIFFARLASTVGIEEKVQLIQGRRYHLPDGSDRFLVDEPMLSDITKSLGGEWIEPFKTVMIHNMRSMSNWCLRKR